MRLFPIGDAIEARSGTQYMDASRNVFILVTITMGLRSAAVAQHLGTVATPGRAARGQAGTVVGSQLTASGKQGAHCYGAGDVQQTTGRNTYRHCCQRLVEEGAELGSRRCVAPIFLATA